MPIFRRANTSRAPVRPESIHRPPCREHAKTRRYSWRLGCGHCGVCCVDRPIVDARRYAGRGGGCSASPFGVIAGIGTDCNCAGGGVMGLEGSVCCNAPLGWWDKGSWTGVISDVRTLTPGRADAGASVSESLSGTNAGRYCTTRGRLSRRA